MAYGKIIMEGSECVVLYFITSLAGACVFAMRAFFDKLSHAVTRRIRFAAAIRIWDSILRLE